MKLSIAMVVVLPVPGNLRSWLVFEQDGSRVVIPDAQF
jgi:hypothetical protein